VPIHPGQIWSPNQSAEVLLEDMNILPMTNLSRAYLCMCHVRSHHGQLISIKRKVVCLFVCVLFITLTFPKPLKPWGTHLMLENL
jgi:hypothetical protein